MLKRWRVRPTGLAIVLSAAVLAGAATALVAWTVAPPPRERAVVVTRPDGTELTRAELGEDGEFALRYRNSLYGSVAEETYRALPDGTFELVALAADELAVLEEYYAIDEPAVQSRASSRGWTAAPADPVVVDELRVAASDLGERRLIVAGHQPIELWRLVEDGAATVVIRVVGP